MGLYRIGWAVGLACLVSVTVLGPGGCGGQKEITVGQSDSGSTVKAAVHDVIVVRLAENPTTGFSWKMTQSSGLEVLGDEYIADEAPGDMVGVGGTHEWRIKVAEPGEQVIKGEYRQEWNPHDNAQHFSLTVDAK